MASVYILVIVCGLLALAYGIVTSRQVLAANAGSARMQEISGAVQVGASAYLNRQYRTIAIVGVVILIILGITLGLWVALGYLIGAVLSGAAGSPPASTSPSGPVRSPACWWSDSGCSAPAAITSFCARYCRATNCARCS